MQFRMDVITSLFASSGAELVATVGCDRYFSRHFPELIPPTECK